MPDVAGEVAISNSCLSSTSDQSCHTALSRVDDHEVHDLLCVGFGPASLAIAVALHDMIAENSSAVPKVRFLERQASFGWHAGMLLPGTKMQISFIKDLATLRDPRSKYTFLNYLKQHGRLAQFANLDTFLPFRVEFEDYLKWAARGFEDVVDYGREVVHVKPIKRENAERYDCLEVVSRDIVTGNETRLIGRNVVIAVGGRPSTPAIFPKDLSQVVHSSQYKHRIPALLPNKDKAYNIAVVGSGQSAAEIFNDLHTRYPNATTQMIIRSAALRPSDDSPFVNEVFDPEEVDGFYRRPQEARSRAINSNKATNYSVVRLTLLEKLYEDLYLQSIHQPDKNKWQHRILTSREIVQVTEISQNKRVNLTLRSNDAGAAKTKEVLSVDAVVLATGYVRNSHVDLLQDCQIINGDVDGEWTVSRDYQVKLNREFATDDVGIYLQGCNEATHGLSDSLLSILATRSGDLVQSIFGR